jgi:hypothetical protein
VIIGVGEFFSVVSTGYEVGFEFTTLGAGYVSVLFAPLEEHATRLIDNNTNARNIFTFFMVSFPSICVY